MYVVKRFMELFLLSIYKYRAFIPSSLHRFFFTSFYFIPDGIKYRSVFQCSVIANNAEINLVHISFYTCATKYKTFVIKLSINNNDTEPLNQKLCS